MVEKVDIQHQGIGAAQAQAAADAMFDYLRDVLYDPEIAKLDIEALPQVYRDLGEGLLFVCENITESRNLANDLAHGNLNSPRVSPENEFASGLKNLQSTLKHITWQVGQVAKGDYQQKLSFAGEFSESINDMIAQLAQRDEDLRAEILRNKKLADDMQTNVAFFETMAANMVQWIIVVDIESRELLYTNHQAVEVLLDADHLEDLRTFMHDHIHDGRHGANSGGYSEYESCSVMQSIIELPGRDGSPNQYFRGTEHPLAWRDREALVFVFTDVSEEQREREELENVAYLDALTGTYSRHYGMQLLDKWLTDKEKFTISFVDMDSLKFVNDTYGHNEGDVYIMAVCNLLKGFDRKAKVCRLGGDEFMLLCKGWTKAETDERLEFLRTELGKTSDEHYLRSISYGVVEIDKSNTKSGSLLLSEADEIMYEYKRARKMQRRSES